MPPTRTLDPAASFAACLGALLRRLRTLQGLTQSSLGRLAGYDGSYIGAVERAAVRPSRHLVERCDHTLHADGLLLALWPLADNEWSTPPPGDVPARLALGRDPPGGAPPDRDPPGRRGPGGVPPDRDSVRRQLSDEVPLDPDAVGRRLPEGVPLDPDHLGGPRLRAAPRGPVAPDPFRRGGGSGAVLEAMEVARRAEASDVGPGTMAEIERAVARLREAGAMTPPEVLIPAVEAQRRYVGGLLAGRLTLAGRRRLLVAAGWLSLLLAQLHFDAGDRQAAEANRDAAHRLAGQAGHAELVASAVEALASWALADGRFRDAVQLARAGQDLAPPASAAALQLTLDEVQAWVALGDGQEAAAARHQATLTRAMLPGTSSTRPTADGTEAGASTPGLHLTGAAAS